MHQPSFPRIGELFVERYQIEEVVGAGGFSQVYRAAQVDLGRSVAIKVLKSIVDPTKSADERAQKFEQVSRRFEREAKLISRLKDRNTVMMYDYGTTEDGLLFMVLEYVDGITVSELLHRDGSLEPERVVKILRQALTSLHEAHTLGVLHRDVKPGNIMVYDHVGRSDQVKVLDFGIAKTVDGADGTNEMTSGDVTADDVLVGTPRYMSPEQIRGKNLAASSDIYSLGLVAYEMLNGTKAVDADSSLRIIARHLDTDPIHLPPDMSVPSRLRGIINKMLVKDPDDRHASCEEVIRELEQWDQDVATSHEATMTAEHSAFSGEVRPESSRSGNRFVIAGIVALLLVIVGLVTLPSMLKDVPSAEDASPGVPSTETSGGPGAVAVAKPGAGPSAAEETDEISAEKAADDEEPGVAEATVSEQTAVAREAAAAAAAAAVAQKRASAPDAAEQEQAETKEESQRARAGAERRRTARKTKDERGAGNSANVEDEEPIFKPFPVD